MKLIKINKALLILAFFMPFTVSMCSRSEILSSGKPVEQSSVINHDSQLSANYFSYLLYPTDYSISGFGFTYKFMDDVIHGNCKPSLIELITLAFTCSILGLILTFYQHRRLVLYLSLLNLTCFFILIIIIWMVDNFKNLLGFFLWGFWLAVILSVVDLYLTRRNIYRA